MEHSISNTILKNAEIQFQNKTAKGEYITNNILKQFRSRILEIITYHQKTIDNKITYFSRDKDFSYAPENTIIVQERIEKIKLIQKNLEYFMERIIKIFPKESDQIQIFNGLILAVKTHIDDKNRLEGQPVIGHVLEVATKLLDTYHITDKDLIISGLLHDSIEDNPEYLAHKKTLLKESPTTNDISNAAIEVIKDIFNDKVAHILAKVSKPNFDKIIENQQTLGRKKNSQEIKNELYVTYVREVIKDPSALIIKYADFEVNALEMLKRSMPEGEKKNNQMKKYCGVFKAFIEAFEDLENNHPLFAYKEKILKKINTTQNQYHQYLFEKAL